MTDQIFGEGRVSGDDHALPAVAHAVPERRLQRSAVIPAEGEF